MTEIPYRAGELPSYFDVIRELSAVRAAANILNSKLSTKKKICYDEMFDSQIIQIHYIDSFMHNMAHMLKESGCNGTARKRIKQLGAIAAYLAEAIHIDSGKADYAQEYLTWLEDSHSETDIEMVDDFVRKFLDSLGADERDYYEVCYRNMECTS